MKDNNIRISNDSNSTLIIAEIAQAHDGSLGSAHAYIDAVAEAGAYGIKFQTHIAAAESTPGEPWRVKFSPQDDSRYDYWKRMEFSEDQWHGLKKHADDRDLIFLSSPFSLEAHELLSRVGIYAWKIASGEVSNIQLVDAMLKTGLPIWLSTGMSSLDEIDKAVERIQSYENPLTVLQCSSIYPTPPEKVGLNLIPFFRDRYKCNVGLSDHSGSIFPGLAAAVLGADLVEVHVTFSRDSFGPDISSSITLMELRQLVDGIHYISKTIENPVDKDQIARELAETRAIFTKSVALLEDLPQGTVLRADHLTGKKPGTGIPVTMISEVVGKKLTRDMSSKDLLDKTDLT